jgi:hypothetical protein
MVDVTVACWNPRSLLHTGGELAKGSRGLRSGCLTSNWRCYHHWFESLTPSLGRRVGEPPLALRQKLLTPTNTSSKYPTQPRIRIDSTVIDRMSDHYGEVEVGGVLAIVGSTDKLEISSDTE